ncbi:MAG: pantoate--beta-alanine ligase [Actinobacteria bacterium]|nr:pantoate--beta-alanine ligase [Actinomycetota bacterium]
MKVCRTIDELRNHLTEAPRPVGLVPTMGALHEGHLSLVRAARDRCDTIVMSIFVNPLQFGPGEDFDRYPRSEQADLAAAEREKVDLVFVPSVAEMYPDDRSTTVRVAGVSENFEGAIRPDHFDGVATVVTKLFGIVQPDIAFFGRKDAQQLAVVRRLVADLSLPIEVVACETVRDPDGLAMSSRNAYLSAEDRERATALWKALEAGAAALRRGGDPAEAEKAMLAILEPATDHVDYVAVVDPDTFSAPLRAHPHLLIVAARLGETRLIDNLLVEDIA